jgi:transcriptional regulator of acetoin/glycerol metabolism
VIEHVLQNHGGKVTASADVLGLTRQGLYKKMKRLGIDASTFQVDTNPAVARRS